jgi:hypothetical protein
VVIGDLLTIGRFPIVPSVPIVPIVASGLSGSNQDTGEFVRFLPERPADRAVRYSSFDENLQPERRLVRFLYADSKLVDEISSGPRTANGPVVRSDRRCSVSQLDGNLTVYWIRRESLCEANNVDRKLLRSGAKDFGCHAAETSQEAGQSVISRR